MTEISVEDPLVKGYLFYVCVLVLKTLIVTLLTIRQRFTKKAMIAPEDAKFANNTLKSGEIVTVKHDDEDVERVRRAHLNDLENIPMFIFTGLVYVLTKPKPMVALNLFRLFTACRILHTFVYAVIVVPQPARAIFFLIGYIINIYMLFVSLVTFFYP